MEHNTEAAGNKFPRHHLLPKFLRGIGSVPVIKAISGDVTTDDVDAALGNLKAAWGNVNTAAAEVMERLRDVSTEVVPSSAPVPEGLTPENDPSLPTE